MQHIIRNNNLSKMFLMPALITVRKNTVIKLVKHRQLNTTTSNTNKMDLIERLEEKPKFGLIKIALNVSIFFLIGSWISKSVTNLLEQNNIYKFSDDDDDDNDKDEDNQDSDEY